MQLNPTFDKRLELVVFNLAALHVNLECQEDGEQELMVLIQTTSRVFKHLVRHVLDDVGYTLGCDWALLGPGGGKENKGQGSRVISVMYSMMLAIRLDVIGLFWDLGEDRKSRSRVISNVLNDVGYELRLSSKITNTVR